MAEVTEYKVASLTDIADWLPYPPWEGPPLPHFFPPWPWNVPAYVKRMSARLIPFSIPEVNVYVLRAAMEGTYRGTLENIGEVALTSGDLWQTLEVLKYILLQKAHELTPFVGTGQTAYVDFTFKVEGWDIIQALWDYFTQGVIDVDTVADVHIPGRSEAGYKVAPLDQRFEVAARLRVENMNWYGW